MCLTFVHIFQLIVVVFSCIVEKT